MLTFDVYYSKKSGNRFVPGVVPCPSDIDKIIELTKCTEELIESFRGGDKDSETELVDGKCIMQAMKKSDGACVFVLTDDYRQILSLQAEYPALKFASLCQPQENGYRHAEFCKQPSMERHSAIVRLLASVDFLLKCRLFVGSITTGPSVFIMKLRAGQTSVLAVDCPQEELPFALTQTIDVRAEISKRNMRRRV